MPLAPIAGVGFAGLLGLAVFWESAHGALVLVFWVIGWIKAENLMPEFYYART